MNIEEKIKDILGSKVIDSGYYQEQTWVRINNEDIVDAVTKLKDDSEFKFDLITDVCGVDNLPMAPRFEVVYHLTSRSKNVRLRIKVAVPDDTLTVPTVTSVWKGADWMEREAYDMYGIRFSGHPDMRRILMHEDFLDYPQRRDFPLKGWRAEED